MLPGVLGLLVEVMHMFVDFLHSREQDVKSRF